MLRWLSNVTYPGHARLATDRRLLEGDNWNCGCDGANRDEHLTLGPRDPPLGTRQNYTKVSDRVWVRDHQAMAQIVPIKSNFAAPTPSAFRSRSAEPSCIVATACFLDRG